MRNFSIYLRISIGLTNKKLKDYKKNFMLKVNCNFPRIKNNGEYLKEYKQY
jgi:hypothetical protein